MTDSMPTEREIVRAVKRAEAGKSIDVSEAVALLAARGDNLTHLMAVPLGYAMRYGA